MIIYYLISVFLIFFAAYFTLHLILASGYKTDEVGGGELPNTFAIIGALRPDVTFIERLKKMVHETRSLPIKWYVVLQDSNKEMELELREIVDFVDHVQKPQAEGNPYHHILRFASQRIQSFQNELGWNESKVILLDLDNEIPKSSVIRLMKQSLVFDVVQGKRVAKSSADSLGKLDGLSESLNDMMMRASRSRFNAPIELSGSGFITGISLFDKAVQALDPKAPGMDKNLLIQMISAQPQLSMKYDEGAVLFDEKTEDSTMYGRQRLRWFGNQYYNAHAGFRPLVKAALVARRYGIIDYAISLWRPPRLAQAVVSIVSPMIDLILFLNVDGFIPMLSISAMIFAVGVAVFLQKMNISKDVFGLSVKAFTLGIKNLGIAIKSLSPKLKGTFIATRQ